MSFALAHVLEAVAGRDAAPRDVSVSSVSLGWAVAEAALWVVMCAAWSIYHVWLSRKHGVAHKSTRPVSIFLALEASSKSFVLIAIASGNVKAVFAVLVFDVIAFIGAPSFRGLVFFCSLFHQDSQL
jgi:hypothetical protein